ncbi:MAG: hypothetical protein QXX35_05360 [Desulfurococcaceae archaeon]|uniref:B box-type domain-containing protein n=1 Tax=Staphylothermus marinus TaxID=2280 RepID=A0A7C4HEM3_STAMA
MNLCSICESKQSVFKCSICGRNVCEKDFDLDKKICRICCETLCKICNKYLSIDKCSICGRNGCEKCLIKITPFQYICIDCYRKMK